MERSAIRDRCRVNPGFRFAPSGLRCSDLSSIDAGWVEPPRNPSSFINAIDGYRGVYHRARIRATRWLNPSCALVHLDVGGLDHRPPFCNFGLLPAAERLRRELILRRHLQSKVFK